MGETQHTAVLLKPGFFGGLYPKFTLMPETLIHAYGRWADDAVFGSSYFTVDNHLWRDENKTHTISTWIGADCRCTPENPANTPGSCRANAATW